MPGGGAEDWISAPRDLHSASWNELAHSGQASLESDLYLELCHLRKKGPFAAEEAGLSEWGSGFLLGSKIIFSMKKKCRQLKVPAVHQM